MALNCAVSAHLLASFQLLAIQSLIENETMAFSSRFLQTNLCEGKYLLSLFTVHSRMTGAYGKEKSDILRYGTFIRLATIRRHELLGRKH